MVDEYLQRAEDLRLRIFDVLDRAEWEVRDLGAEFEDLMDSAPYDIGILDALHPYWELILDRVIPDIHEAAVAMSVKPELLGPLGF